MTKINITTATLKGHITEAKAISENIAKAASFLDTASMDFLRHAQVYGDFTLATKFRDTLTEGSANGMGNLRKAFTDFFTAFSPAVLRARKEGVVFAKDRSEEANKFQVVKASENLPSTFKKAGAPITIESLIATLAGYSFADKRDALIKKAEKAGLGAGAIAQLEQITSVAKAKALVNVQAPVAVAA